MVLLLVVVLRRSKPKTARVLAAASLLNKLEVHPTDLEVKIRARSPPLSSPSSSHGGERRGTDWGLRAWGMGAEAQLQSSSTGPLISAVFLGQQRPLRTMAYCWRHSLFFLQVDVPMRRIFGLKEAVQADDDPSGLVPGVDAGGCPSSSYPSCGGEERPQGPDRLFQFSFEVVLVKIKVLNVICPTA
jgi:hypothetical protein